MRFTLAGIVLLGAGTAVAALGGRPPEIRVPAGESVQSAVNAAPDGATLTLGPGMHRGPVVVRSALTLLGEAGAKLVAPRSAPATLKISGADVVVADLAVGGGSSGVLVRGTERVVLRNVGVRGAELHGIEIVDASAYISEATVGDLKSGFAQGIEVRVSEGHPDTVIRDSFISGRQEGIVSHVSHVVIEDNHVSDTTMRGIAVTEMSHGVVARNRVTDALGAGLYCGDMSRCYFADNNVSTVGKGPGGNSTAGWGLTLNYHAQASSDGDRLSGVAGPVGVFVSSGVQDRSPLELGRGWAALLPAVIAVLAAAVLLGLARIAGSPLARSLSSSGRQVRSASLSGAVGLLMTIGLGVQSFHIVEHGLQVYRVHFDGVPSRGGIVGPAVDAEWVHFAYNTAVLAAILMVAVARRHDWTPAADPAGGDRWLAAAGLLQTYHVVEHSLKVVQHVTTGAKVNPGLLGAVTDLVWLHFTINLAVYVGFVLACLAYLPPRLSFEWAERALVTLSPLSSTKPRV